MTKLKVGFYGITGCAGCLLSFIFNEDDLLDVIEKVDLKSFPLIKEKATEDRLDVVFLEGLVANNHDLKALQKIRRQTDFLIAMGACATTGGAPALRNFQDPINFKHLQYHKAIGIADKHPSPVDAYVHVDLYIEGCPPNKKEILKVLDDLVLGKKPYMYSKPVCVECRKNKNPCLLEMGEPCLGPVTRGGCDSICTNNNLVCWGCRGPAKEGEVTFKEMIKLLKDKGYDEKFVRGRLNTFAGMRHKETEDAQNS